jgi:hypothetical protein
MVWPFYFLEKLGDRIVAQPLFKAKRERRYLKWLTLVPRAGVCQPLTEQTVHGLLEGVARLTRLPLQLDCNVIVDGEGRAHIMMMHLESS